MIDFEFNSIEEQQNLNQKTSNQHKETLDSFKQRIKNYFEEDNDSVSDCAYTVLNDSIY